MELLQIIGDGGYPTEYLLSRIRGKRAFFLRDWDDAVLRRDPLDYLKSTRYGELISRFSREATLKHRQKEYQWVYYQMNKKLRDIFMHFFMSFEINTLIICLRYKRRRGNAAEIEDILSFSLLSEKIKELLQRDTEVPFVLEELEGLLFYADGMSRLKEDGGKSFEQTIAGEFLQHAIKRALHPVLRSFFLSVIDFRNIITLYKFLRWKMKTEPVFIQGGRIEESIFKKVMLSHGMSEFFHLVSRFIGQKVKEPVKPNIEKILKRNMSKQIKKMGRESLDIGFILDYLWRCYLEAQNLSILVYGRGIPGDMLQDELVI